MESRLGIWVLAVSVGCSSSAASPPMPTPKEAIKFSMEETEEWLIANLYADTRCRGDRPFRHAITRLNIVEASNCVMKLQYTGDWRPATIPMVDVWQIDNRSPDLYDVTVVIRWWADAERDAWYLEDLNNRPDNAGWRAEPGSAIFVLHVHGPRGVDDGDGIALMLDHYADLCNNRQGPPQS